MGEHRVIIDESKCVGCGMCVKICVAQNIALNQNKASILLDKCVLCGHCAAVCPKMAVSITGYPAGQAEKNGQLRLDPDDALQVIRTRRTIRHFKQKEIPQEAIAQVLEAGRLTHTAKNMQDVSFIVLQKEKDRIERMAVRLFQRVKPFADLISPLARNQKIDSRFFFRNAPVIIAIAAKNKTNGILAAQNMEFIAEANGLGVLYSGFFTTAANASHQIKKAMQLPKGKRVAMTLVLGYPDVKFLRSAPRKELDVRYL